MSLRPYQDATLDSVGTHLMQGVHRQLAVLATGTGKTVIFSNLFKKLNLKKGVHQILVLAHRDELIDQACDKMKFWNPDLKVEIEMAEKYASLDSDVIIASVATLGRFGSARIDRFDWSKIAVIVCDEAHHSVASTYMNIFSKAGLLDNKSDRLLLGVTATPNRGDGQALAKLYDKIVFTYTMRQAIEDGWLCDMRGIRLNTRNKLDNIKMVGGDFNQGDLAKEVNNPVRNQQIVKAWRDNALGRQTVVFCVDIQHAKDLAETFRTAGISAQAVWGDDPDRAEKLQDHKNGDITVLTNCGVLTEGYDDWRISCIVMARPTKSQALFQQMAGRGTRLEEGIGNLKEWLAAGKQTAKKDCLLIDVVDVSNKHSLVTLPSLLGMNAKMDLKGKSVIGAVKKLEELQQKRPDLDFNQITDLDKVDARVEAINLWEVKFEPEVIENSELSWHKAYDGSLVLLLPNKERVSIKQNLLDQWEINAVINGKKFKGVRNNVEEAFIAADGLVSKVASDSLKILRRKEEWHDEPMTEPQANLLRKWYKNRPLPQNMTKGQAAKLISQFIAGKVQGREMNARQ